MKMGSKKNLLEEKSDFFHRSISREVGLLSLLTFARMLRLASSFQDPSRIP